MAGEVFSGSLQHTIQPAVLPVFLELPSAVVEKRIAEFADLSSEPAGIAGTRLAGTDGVLMQTEEVFAVNTSSKREQKCTCCSNTIQQGVEHVLFAFPPQNTTPYRHIDQGCFKEIVLPSLVSARRVASITAYRGIRQYTKQAQQIKAGQAA